MGSEGSSIHVLPAIPFELANLKKIYLRAQATFPEHVCFPLWRAWFILFTRFLLPICTCSLVAERRKGWSSLLISMSVWLTPCTEKGRKAGDKGRQDPGEGGHTIDLKGHKRGTRGDKGRQDLGEGGHTIHMNGYKGRSPVGPPSEIPDLVLTGFSQQEVLPTCFFGSLRVVPWKESPIRYSQSMFDDVW